MNTSKVSIIIPVSKWNNYLDECVRNCLSLDYPDYEIIILPDKPLTRAPHALSPLGRGEGEGGKFKVFPTGHIGPAAKRNIGLQHAVGEIIAFIDDDTYPQKEWLKNAIMNFQAPEVLAVGGPAVTPGSDSLCQRASGAVYESLIGGGTLRYRYIPQRKKYVDDYPSCNFIVRKDALGRLGGFQTNFWPGEDTALCLDIVHKLGGKIVYDPEAIIYHHRRRLFKGHLRQIKAYALHRGYFAKRFPETSFRLSYFLLSIFVGFLFFGWLINSMLYLGGVMLYLLLVLISVLRLKGWQLKWLVFSGIISTHIIYGIWFIIGLLSKKLTEEKLNV